MEEIDPADRVDGSGGPNVFLEILIFNNGLIFPRGEGGGMELTLNSDLSRFCTGGLLQALELLEALSG